MVQSEERISSLTTFALPVPSTYDVVYGLAKGSGREIYLSVSAEFAPGVCARIYAFDRDKHTFGEVINFEQATGYDAQSGMMPHSKVHLSLTSYPEEGRVFAASHFTAPALGQTDFDPIEAYRGKYQGSFLVEYDSSPNRITNYGCLIPGEGCRISVLDVKHRYIYLVSHPRNHLYQFHYPSRTLRDLGRLGQENSFGLEIDESGNVYTSDDFGRFVKFSLQDNRLEEMNCFVPLRCGRRRQGNFSRRMTRGCDGSFYGFGNKGVRLFRFSPAKEEVVDFGPIWGREAELHYEYPLLPPAKALVQTDPGSLYVAFGGDGIYIGDDQAPSLVKFDLNSREAVPLGEFVAEDGTPAWIPQCALFCEDENAIYFGMQQAVEGLRLWKVSLIPEVGRPSPIQRNSLAFRRHLEHVQSVPFSKSVEGQKELPYVNKGQVTMTELGWFGEGKVIPPDESAISDLIFVGDTLYGITTGRKVHLFRYAPYQMNRFVENYDVHVADLGTLSRSGGRRTRIFEWRKTKKLIVLVRTDVGLDCVEYDLGAEARTHRSHIHSVPHWDPFHSNSIPFRHLFTIRGTELPLRNYVLDERDEWIYTTDSSGQLTRIRLPGGEQKVCPGIRTLDNTFIQVAADQFFAVSDEGEALVFSFSELTAPARAAMGERDFSFTCAALWNAARSVVLGTDDGKIVVYRLDEGSPPVILSLPHAWKVRSMAAATDGGVYGFYGNDNAIGEVFVLSSNALSLKVLGILQIRSDPRFWVVHRCDSMVGGKNGEVYFGESDRISHLVTYYPVANPA